MDTFQTPNLLTSTKYWVRVSNGVGTADVVFTQVMVDNVLPVIIGDSGDVQIAPNGTATLSVDAVGPDLHYRWYRGDAVSNVIVGTDSPTYTTAPMAVSERYFVFVFSGSNESYAIGRTMSVSVAGCAHPVISSTAHSAPGETWPWVNASLGSSTSPVHYEWREGTPNYLQSTTSYHCSDAWMCNTTYNAGLNENLPPVAGTYPFFVRVTDACGSALSQLIEVKP